MNEKKSRVSYFVWLNILSLGLISVSGPSHPTELDLWADAPDAEEIAFYEELIRWIDPRNLEDESLRQAIRKSTSFELFRSYHDRATRDEFLSSVPYGDRIRSVADRHGLDGFLIASVVEAESSFDPLAISRRGAVGLMQLMPASASVDPDRLTEPNLNLELGARYLGSLLVRFQGDLELALAAYNAGPTAVRRYGGLPPYRETREYVEKVLRLYVNHHRTVWQATEAGELLVSS